MTDDSRLAQSGSPVVCMFCDEKAVRTMTFDKGTPNEVTYRTCLEHVMTAMEKVGLK